MEVRVERVRLRVAASAHDALRHLAEDRDPFALIGDWAGGGAILGSEPIARMTSLDELDRLPDALGGGRLASITRAGSGSGSGLGGGWFGWLGYGAGALVDRFPVQPPRPKPLDTLGMSFYDHVLRLDADGAWWFEALVTAPRREVLRRRRHELESRLSKAAPRRPWHVGEFAARAPGTRGHVAAVEAALESIRAGEIFQANICMRLEADARGSSAEAFATAAERLEPPRAAFVARGEATLLSLSPELFLRRTGRDVETAPIKGTVRRDGPPTLASEIAARDSLTGSSKANAENVMIVDLMRNDLGRVCETGSISAELPPVAEPHPGVWHLVSRVRGRLRPDVGDHELVAASFPPGSVTGAPKLQAIEVIARLEPVGREAYTGAIGFATPRGLELSVAIRTFERRGDRTWIGCGGGIVADSEPVAELAEALDKARPLVAALGSRIASRDETAASGAAGRRASPLRPGRVPRPDPDLGLLETISVESSEPVRLGQHLGRLERSLRELRAAPLAGGLADRVRAAAREVPDGRGRIRLIARPHDGDVALEVHPHASGGPAPADAILEPCLLPGGLGPHKWADRRFLEPFVAAGTEPVWLDLDGAVLEAGSANVWILERGRLVTPPADGRILPGVTRGSLLAAGELDVRIEPFDLRRLRAAEAVVLTSAVRLARAAAIGGPPTEAARELATHFRALARGQATSGRHAGRSS
ncbi:bifunctional aminodeoxychorismate synthase component I/aminodeoxychorismate lyase [Thermoleophilia bacterium SCSIO 60948]|nr:bifunctional aminodeoxychorismate synthase component I/aminodeoxychorismate lyase [Thermoleophilia bacterium SCSIO 60948]